MWKHDATPGPWKYESYPSGSRVVSFNYPLTGPFGSPELPKDGIHRHLEEVRQTLCECCERDALHWVGADHDEQERHDLVLAAAAPALFEALAGLIGLYHEIWLNMEGWADGFEMELHRRVEEAIAALKAAGGREE